MVGFAPGGTQPAAHEGPVTLGQVAEDIALLVADAAMHRCVLAQDIANGFAQGF